MIAYLRARIWEWTTGLALLCLALAIGACAWWGLRHAATLSAIAGGIVSFLVPDRAVRNAAERIWDCVVDAALDDLRKPRGPVTAASLGKDIVMKELLQLGLLLAKDGPSTAAALVAVIGGDTSDEALLALAKAVAKDLTDLRAALAPAA